MARVKPKSARNADDLLREVVGLYQEAQRSAQSCCCAATGKECDAVTLLGRKGPLTIQEFATGMGLEKTWASRLADRLEKRGFASRGRHPEDGRCCLLQLTPVGEKACGSLEESIGNNAADFLTRIPVSERAGIESALASLRDALAATVEESGGTCAGKCD